VTEAEWDACADPAAMLESLQGKAGERKLRLFACACVRRAWDLLDDAGRRAVEAAEAFADGLASGEALRAASRAARGSVDAALGAANTSWHGFSLSGRLAGVEAASQAASGVGYRDGRGRGGIKALALGLAARSCQAAFAHPGENVAQCGLLREVLGSPFRPTALDPSWLAWNGGTVAKLAAAIYDGQRIEAATLRELAEGEEHEPKEADEPPPAWRRPWGWVAALGGLLGASALVNLILLLRG